MLIKKNDLMVKVLFTIFVISWCVGDLTNNINDNYKYIFLLLHFSITFAFCILSLKKIKQNNKVLPNFKNVKKMLIVFLLMLLYSLLIQYYNGNFMYRTWYEIICYLLPLIYAFIIFCYVYMNGSNKKEYDFYFYVLFIGQLLTWIILYYNKLTISNILSISFVKSYSPFESPYAGIFFLFFIYFYLNKKMTLAIISGFVSILSFKRLDVIFIAIFPFYYHYFKNKKISMKTFNFLFLIFALSPIIIKFLYSNEFANFFYSNFKIQLDSFVKGRTTLLSYVINSNMKSNGIGSISVFLSNLARSTEADIHCDVVKISLESTYILFLPYLRSLLNLTEKNSISIFVICFILFTMTFSQCITGIFLWILVYLLIFYINSISEVNQK